MDRGKIMKSPLAVQRLISAGGVCTLAPSSARESQLARPLTLQETDGGTENESRELEICEKPTNRAKIHACYFSEP